MARVQKSLAWALLAAVMVSAGQSADAAAASAAPGRPAPPKNLPGWLDNTKKNHIFYKRGRYNFDV
jgi:hypothetical protein